MLYLFKNMTPNTHGSTHYFFDQQADFFNHLLTEAQSDYITAVESDYQMTNGDLRVILAKGVAENVTYAAIVDFSQTPVEYTFYHVDSLRVLSGYAFFRVSLDLWAQYVFRAGFHNFLVNSTNLVLPGKNLFFPPCQTENDEFDRYGARLNPEKNVTRPSFTVRSTSNTYSRLVESESYDIVMAITSATPENMWHDGGTTGGLFLFSFSYDTSWKNSVRLTAEKCGNIFKRLIPGESATYRVDASVSGVWIVPHGVFSTVDETTQFETKLMTSSGQFVDTLMEAKEILYATGFCSIIVEFSPNFACFVGTRENDFLVRGSSLPREIVFDFVPSLTGVVVKMRDGETEQDLSNAFKFPYFADSKQENSMGEISKAIQTGLSVVGSVAGIGVGVATGNAAQIMGGTVGVVSGIQQMLPGERNGSAGRAVSAGNGIATCFVGIGINNITNNDLELVMPFTVRVVKATNDEKSLLAKFGVPCSVSTNFDDILTAQQLFPEEQQESFVRGEVEVRGINTEARLAIQQEIAQGIHYEVL